MTIVTVGCEHSPLFPAYMDEERLLTLDYDVVQSVLEWYNSLTNTTEKAYYQEDADLFCFPDGDAGEWSEYPCEPDGTYLAPDWLQVQPACPECLCYVPCDCEQYLLNEDDLKAIEASALTRHDISMENVRNMVYTIRELEAQLRTEQS